MGRRTSTRVFCAALLAVLVAAFLGGSAAAVSFSITPGGSPVTVTISTAGDKATATFTRNGGAASLARHHQLDDRVDEGLALEAERVSGVHGLRDEDREVRRHEHAAGERHLQARRRPEPGPTPGKVTLKLYNVPPDASSSMTIGGARGDGDDDGARPERVLHLLGGRGATSGAQHDRRDGLLGEPHAQEPRWERPQGPAGVRNCADLHRPDHADADRRSTSSCSIRRARPRGASP